MFKDGNYRLLYRDETTEDKYFTSAEAMQQYKDYRKILLEISQGTREPTNKDIMGMIYLGI